MQMNIMVAGAGIGGLAVAAALRDAGHKVRVFERSPELRVAGTGITLAANAMKALQVLGLADKALLAGHVVRHADIRTSKGRVLAKLPMRRMEARVGLPSIGIQRTALLEILHEAAGPENVTTSARAAGYRNEDGGVVLLFADGTEARGDLLVGADGNRSAIRDRLREPSPLNYTGYTCWRGNADITPAQLGCDGFFEAWGRGARFGGVMVGPGEFTWYAAKNEPAGGADTPATIAARVRADFGDWAEPIPSILAATPAERMFRLDIADRTPDARWIDGRVALLGDAAHAITPNMGQGACQALEDAGLDENTLIFFSSDNGPSRETRNWLDGTEDPYYGGTAGIFRGHKFSLFDGGIRMPALMRYPARVPGGQVCDGVGAMMDVVPTCLEAAGIDLPGDRVIDGESILPMVSEGAASPHEQLCWENGNQLAIREGDWKLVLNGRLTGDTADEVHLSNLADDPGERTNLADAKPDFVSRLTEDVELWYAEVRGELDARQG